MVCQQKDGEEMPKFHFEKPFLPPVPTSSKDVLEWKKKQFLVWLVYRELEIHGDLE
tara:strand:+ start:63 stop:230 length:168 start_codon:yes stop_codon:yes gene_type:complete